MGFFEIFVVATIATQIAIFILIIIIARAISESEISRKGIKIKPFKILNKRW
jgi:hypothetical protein